MTIPIKTLANGFSLPELGFGTWQMGGRTERDPANDDEADVAAIECAIELGLTHIDTAEVYAAGHTETLVGQAIQGYERQRLFITSKAYVEHLSYDGLLRACEASLKRLGTDYLDLYLAHRYNPAIPLAETVRGLNELVRRGLVRHIGVSNFNATHLREAQVLSHYPIVCNQVHYSLKFREPEADNLLTYCQKHDVMLVAWRPTNKGKLGTDIPPIVAELYKKYDKTPIQIAINWLVSQPNVVTLTKARRQEHLRENLGGVGWRMEPADIELLRHEYPNQQTVSDTVPLG